MRDKKWKSLLEDGPVPVQEVRRQGDTIVFKKLYPSGTVQYGTIDGWGRVTWLEGDN